MTEETTGSKPGFTSRRDALKLGGVAALGGTAAALAASAGFTSEAEAASPPAHIPTSLQVSIDGTPLQGVRSMEVLQGKYTLGGATDSSGKWVSTPTGVDSQTVSLTRYFTGDSAFADIYNSQNGQQAETKTVVIRVLGRKGSTANLFTLFDCFPVAWDGPSYDAAIMAKGGTNDRPTESLSLNFTKIEFK